jgi:hypothetical protein
MTGSQIARRLHGIKAGKGWQCKCPNQLAHAHGDRSRSLSVREIGGWVRIKCFSGCTRGEILGAMGLSVRDLSLTEFKPNRQWEVTRRDEDTLVKLTRQHGLAIMAQAVLPEERAYWRAVEKNIAVKGRALRDKLYPSEKKQREMYRIIRDYGWDELWECVP